MTRRFFLPLGRVRFFSEIQIAMASATATRLASFVRDAVNQQNAVLFLRSQLQQMRTVQVPDVEINAGADLTPSRLGRRSG